MKEKFDSINEEFLLGQAFLDCGAYSVLTGYWEHLPTADYERFVAKNHDRFGIIAAPDVIGSAEDTFQNFIAFQKYLEDAGVWNDICGRVAITYHLSDRDPEILKGFLDYAYSLGVRWFAVGGIVNPALKYINRFIGIQSVLSMVDRKKFKVHLFGGHNTEFIRVFRPDSVDSSTYVAAGKNLTAVYYEGWKAKKVKMPRDSQEKQLEVINRILIDKFLHWLDKWDISLVSLMKELEGMPDGIRMWLLNGIATVEFEYYVNIMFGSPNNRRFRYWVTMDPDMLLCGSRYGPLSKRVFTEIWRDRCLVAYPQYWEPNTEGKGLANLEYFK